MCWLTFGVVEQVVLGEDVDDTMRASLGQFLPWATAAVPLLREGAEARVLLCLSLEVRDGLEALPLACTEVQSPEMLCWFWDPLYVGEGAPVALRQAAFAQQWALTDGLTTGVMGDGLPSLLQLWLLMGAEAWGCLGPAAWSRGPVSLLSEAVQVAHPWESSVVCALASTQEPLDSQGQLVSSISALSDRWAHRLGPAAVVLRLKMGQTGKIHVLRTAIVDPCAGQFPRFTLYVGRQGCGCGFHGLNAVHLGLVGCSCGVLRPGSPHPRVPSRFQAQGEKLVVCGGSQSTGGSDCRTQTVWLQPRWNSQSQLIPKGERVEDYYSNTPFF